MTPAWSATRDDGASATWRVACGTRAFTVEVPVDAALPAALEHAVREALGFPLDPAPQPPRFTIREETYSHGDLFELEQDTIWTVLDGPTPLWEFRGGTSHGLEGGAWGPSTGSHGCDFVALGVDGWCVLAGDRYAVKCHPLPE